MAPQGWQRGDSSTATPRPKSRGVSPCRKAINFPKLMLAADNCAEAFTPTEKLQKITLILGGTVRTSPWPQQPPEPVVVASSSSARELLEITPMCQNTGREEGNSEVVFVTFVLLFFTVAVLQVLNNWPTDGCCCRVRSYTDVLALPAGLELTEEED